MTLTDAWVKAADSGMTGEFGVLTNSGDEEVTIVGGSSPAAGVVELHEVADGQMKAIDGGFVVPAGGTLTLEPGGYHVMLMQLTGPIAPGDEVTTTLECSTGGSFEVVATAKEFAGGNEEYVGGGMGGMDDMNGASQMPSMDGSQPAG
ncbi:MAG: copper chaperone PCu(A)C [Actinobacteria bacterium]|nr:copper chaperone PCu(A)C [Actinomycetota bacterium]MCB9412696.1 copper chaperone PCu(A)C [Actinomycetota bacterium]